MIKLRPTKIIFFACKLFGLMPLNHRKHNVFKFSNCFIMFFHPLFYLVALITLFTYPTPTSKPATLQINGCKNVCFFSYLTFLIFGAFSYTVCVLSAFKKNKFFVDYYDEIEKFDQHFNKCSVNRIVKIKTDYIRIIMITLIMVVSICLCVFTGLSFMQSQTDWFNFILLNTCTAFPITASVLFQLLFAYLIQEIGWRYEKINYIFRTINKRCNKKMNDIKIFDIAMASKKIRKELESGKVLIKANEVYNTPDTNNTEASEDEDSSESDDLPDLESENSNCERYMVDLFQVHERISSLGVNTNEAFSTAIVSFMTTSFVISVFGIFLLTKVVFTIHFKYDLLIEMTIYVILWTVYLLLTAYLILRICCHAQIESRKTALLIHEIMQKKPTFMLGNDDYYNKMKCFTLQYLHWETYFNFNGSGLFQLDYTFIFSAVSAGTSYLIVLLQFDLNAVL